VIGVLRLALRVGRDLLKRFVPGEMVIRYEWESLNPTTTHQSLTTNHQLLLARFAPYQPKIQANMRGATIVASDSIIYLGVSRDSLPQVIFSFGTAPE
jgi:hypothetical protein